MGSSVHAAFLRILVLISLWLFWILWCLQAQEQTDEAKSPQAWHRLRQLLLFFCLLGRWRVFCQSPGCIGCILRSDDWLGHIYLFILFMKCVLVQGPAKITQQSQRQQIQRYLPHLPTTVTTNPSRPVQPNRDRPALPVATSSPHVSLLPQPPFGTRTLPVCT